MSVKGREGSVEAALRESRPCSSLSAPRDVSLPSVATLVSDKSPSDAREAHGNLFPLRPDLVKAASAGCLTSGRHASFRSRMSSCAQSNAFPKTPNGGTSVSSERTNSLRSDLPLRHPHPYGRTCRTNSRDHKPTISRLSSLPSVLGEDWASCSSDGLPSLPASPGWSRAEMQVESLQPPAPILTQSPVETQQSSSYFGPHRASTWQGPGPSAREYELPGRARTAIDPSQPTTPISTYFSYLATANLVQKMTLNSSHEQASTDSGSSQPMRIPETPPDTNQFMLGQTKDKMALPPRISRSPAMEGDTSDTRPMSQFTASPVRAQGEGTKRAEEDDIELEPAEMMDSVSDASYNSWRNSSSYTSGRETPADIFAVGDRIGPGLYHDGDMIRAAETSDGFAEQDVNYFTKQLEVVQLLGRGSYAVVYLAREVTNPVRTPSAQAQPQGMDIGLSSTPRAAPPPEAGRTPRASHLGWKAMEEANGIASPDESPLYALKCLSKRNLSPEHLRIQRLEVTIHQSIPPHPNIVTLYNAYETNDWLFLVLEYCPGQDLYFWLEEAQDSYGLSRSSTQTDLSSSMSQWSEGEDSLGAAAENWDDVDAIPVSPWLLSTKSPHILLSQRRLQLVSSMFSHMCEAVQFCHDHGVSHRDIKPENFIVEDRRSGQRLPASTGEAVVVKLTDFGLATTQSESSDFNCGSKPYMAFECRHDLSSHYDPKQADTWSLGIVLLNLIFHRSPFREPSVNRCPSFAAFTLNPVLFLMQAFDGLTEDVSRFLCDHVFCDVTNNRKRRVTPHEFAQWAHNLPAMLGRTKPLSGRGPLSYATTPVSLSRMGSMRASMSDSIMSQSTSLERQA